MNELNNYNDGSSDEGLNFKDEGAVETPRLLPVDTLLRQAFELYKARFWTLVGIAILPMLASYALMYVASTLGTKDLSALLMLAVMAILVILLNAWTQAALLIAIRDWRQQISLADALKKTFSRTPSMLWVVILGMLVMTAGIGLFVIPGLIFAVWFAFPAYILISEDVKGTNAFLLSKEYARGYWWAIFYRMAMPILIIMILMIVLGLLTAVLFGVDTANSGLGELISNIFSAVLGPFLAVALYLIYNDLRRIKGNVTPKNSKSLIVTLAILGVIVTIAFMALFVSLISGIMSELNTMDYSDNQFRELIETMEEGRMKEQPLDGALDGPQ